MKKIFAMFLLMLAFTINVSAQIQRYRAQNFAIASVNNGYYKWSEWQKSDVTFTMDLDNDVITIYSQTPQVYAIISYDDPYVDKDGGKQIKFYVIDQDYDRGTIRLRIQTDGSSQLYVDFNDIAWCYGNVIRMN